MSWIKYFLLFQLIVAINAKEKQSERPNIIIIIADDVGWNDFGFHGTNQTSTPNIDALAYNGVILNRLYTSQYCTPSRAALLTGNYATRSGMQGAPIDSNEDRGLPDNMPTMAQHLKKLGYKTHLVGKWHLGSSRKSYTPTEKGFDSFFGYWNGYMGYTNFECGGPIGSCRFPGSPGFLPNYSVPCLYGFDLHEGYRPAWEYQGQYATTLFTNKAVDVINNHKRRDPLFLYVGHMAAHSGKNSTGLEVPDDAENDREFHYIEDVGRRRYAGMVKELDKSIGKIVQALQNKKLLRNSIIFFVSDNGPQSIGIFANKGSAWPLRGLKFTGYEGGVRGSAILYSPLIKSQMPINNELMHLVDLLPTLYSAAGGNVTDLGNIDGVNQWAVIKDGIPTKRKEMLIYIDERLNISAIADYGGRYKLLNNSFGGGMYDGYYGDSGRNLSNPPYDMTKVIFSRTNLAIRKASLLKPWLTYKDGHRIRRQLDLSTVCDMEKREKSKNFKCKGFCLFDIFNDPCETTNIAEENPTLITELAIKLQQHWKQIVPQVRYTPDPASVPTLCNNTWFMWKDDPPYCPLNTKSSIMPTKLS